MWLPLVRNVTKIIMYKMCYSLQIFFPLFWAVIKMPTWWAICWIYHSRVDSRNVCKYFRYSKFDFLTLKLKALLSCQMYIATVYYPGESSWPSQGRHFPLTLVTISEKNIDLIMNMCFIKHFLVQLMHTNYKILRLLKSLGY